MLPEYHLKHFFMMVFLLSTGSGAAPPNRVMERTLEQSETIVLGQLESIARREQSRLFTLQVEYTAKGTPSKAITFSIRDDEFHAKNSSIGLGMRMIVFLEPTLQPEQPFRLTMSGAALLRVSRTSTKALYNVEDGRWSNLCNSSSKGMAKACRLPLDQFLRDMGLPEFKPNIKASFRVLQPRQCTPCDFETQLKKRNMPGMIDCGTATASSVEPHMAMCVRESLKTDKPFQVRMDGHGVDSKTIYAFISDGRHVYEWSFDSSAGGGPQCTALLSQRSCGALDLKDTDTRWPQCQNASPFEVLCDQSQGTYSLGEAEDASKLSCISEGRPRMWLCTVSATGINSAGGRPLPDGPDFICSALATKLLCHEE
jgi:hypothetical protein